MRVTGIECRLVRLPTRRPHRWASLTTAIGSYVLVRLRTDDGIDGWGEATALAQWGGDHGRYYGETPGTVVHVIEDLFAEFLFGADPTDRQTLYEKMDAAIRGHPYAKTAVEAALLDISATRAGLPVYELLGGRRRAWVPLAHSLGLLPLEQVLDEVDQAVAEGARTIKLKVGEDAARDVRTVLAVRERIGPELQLTVDANQGWRTPAEAVRIIQAMEPAQLRFVEQPVPGIQAMAEVAARVGVPLMADESVWTAHDVVEVARAGAALLVSIYTSKAGGLQRAMQADAVALACGLGTNVNGSGETGIGNLGNLHLAAALASLTDPTRPAPAVGPARR
jgi:muconate cycloisomerase